MILVDTAPVDMRNQQGETMKHLSLFSGIGGIDIAAEWAGFETVCFVENNKYCQKVLAKHWPDVPIIEDVKDATKERLQEIMADTNAGLGIKQEGEVQTGRNTTNSSDRTIREGRGLEQESEIMANTESQRNTINESERRDSWYASDSGRRQGLRNESQYGGRDWIIDLISGGFPCQPHSVAGVRKGSADKRNLWPEFRRIIGEIKPRWVLAENVPGLFASDSRRFFGTILADLAEMGYSVGWATYGAVDVGALHRRNRVFIVAYSKDSGVRGSSSQECSSGEETLLQGEQRRGSLGSEVEGCGGESDDVADSTSWGAGRIQNESQEEGTRNSDELLRECGGISGTDQWAVEPSEGTGDVADTISQRGCGGNGEWQDAEYANTRSQEVADGGNGEGWAIEPDVGRVAHGIPSRVDRLKCLGNAVVPAQVFPILDMIARFENG